MMRRMLYTLRGSRGTASSSHASRRAGSSSLGARSGKSWTEDGR
jgi:hypothetical protein